MEKVTLHLPVYVQTAARILIKEGFQVYLAGGAIRDVLLDRPPVDYDLYTNATPEQMIKIFNRAITVGQKFGTIIALQYDEKGEQYEVEITTFRKEAQYVNGRWPSKVEFIDNVNEDLARRDFTINAMALNLAEHGVEYLAEHLGEQEHPPKEFTLIDLFGGVQDLQNKIVKAVGNPVERFTEDGLRAYKACRLASQFQFTIEAATFAAITETLTVAKQVSSERIRDEFVELLMKSPKPSVGIELLRTSGLLELFIPELLEGVAVEQTIGHVDDVYSHTLKTVDKAPDTVKLAALFHDIAKPRTDMKNGHFYGHDTMGADMAQTIMQRLKFPKKEIERVANLVRWHMFHYPDTDPGEIPGESKVTPIWSDGAVRRFIQRVGLENIEDLFALRIADALSNPASMWDETEIERLQERISAVREQDMALKVTDLDINGDDLMQSLALPRGPQLGQILKYLLDEVTENPNVNNRDALLELARTWVAKQPQNA